MRGNPATPRAPLPNILCARTTACGSHSASPSEGSTPTSDEICPQNPEKLLGQSVSTGRSPFLLCRDCQSCYMGQSFDLKI